MPDGSIVYMLTSKKHSIQWSHEQLFRSLMKKGVHGKFLRTVKSLYSNLYASVRTVNGLTKYRYQARGRKQSATIRIID